jgi:hypothetical protein
MLSESLQSNNTILKRDVVHPQWWPKCKYVINGLMCRTKPCLSVSSKESSLKLSRKLHMKDNIMKLGKGVANHDRCVIVSICTST